MTHIRPILLAGVLGMASTALAVKTEFWTHTSPADFALGERTNLVATNHGELKLARELKSLLPNDTHIAAVTAIVAAGDGSVVYATFPDSKLMRLRDGKTETIATLEGTTITAVATDESGAVYVATAGEQAELLKIAKADAKPESIFKQEDVDYIWSIVATQNRLLIGVGTPARVIEVAQKPQTLATLDGENVLSMIGGKDGTLYVGTDTDGLVYKIAPNAKPTLLFDAAEAEISALAFDSQGRLLVATGEAGEHVRTQEPAETGKPEHTGGESTIPSEAPTAPKAPEADGNGIPTVDAEPPAAAHDADKPEDAPPEPAKKNSAGPVQPNTGDEEGGASGNALYRVSDAGLVTELFRDAVVIYGIAVEGESIYLATGESGDVYVVTPASEESAIIAHTDAAQVSGIVRAKDGTIYLATSNAGGVHTLAPGIAAEGTFVSDVLDAGITSKFGKMQLRGQLPEGALMSVSTRSGNAADPDSGTWSDWSAPQPALEFVDVQSPAGRYLQYKLVMKSNGKAVPSLDELRLAYQKPNVAPRVDAVSVAADASQPGSRTISWSAVDANQDAMKFTLYARAIGRGGWVELAHDLDEYTYTWPAKEAADGRYEIKVVASDATDNQPGQGQQASRVSDTIVIDNTAPVIGDVKVDGTTVTLRVVDRNGLLASLDYAIDSVQHWQKRLPDDTMSDSPEERYTLDLGKLAPGQHTLTVRATDSEGNTSFETIGVNVP